MIQQSAIHPARTVAILAMCASLLLAAVGLSILTAPVVRDPENPAYVGNTLRSSTTTSSSQPVRDPENPNWTGASTGDASGVNEATGVTVGDARGGGSSGLTQGLR